MNYCPLGRVHMNMNVTILFVTPFSLILMKKKNLRQVESSHINKTENMNNSYASILEKLPGIKVTLCFILLNYSILRFISSFEKL